jgi:(1->4)-alpha-D-glucan 1-alpha-D-glucosylmutase
MSIPSSTYRVQFHKEFRFSDLRKILDYLQTLGVDTIYAAPILKATPGSMHGYDVTDPHVINPEIGTLDELREIATELRTRKMQWIQDIVPNHMAFSIDNLRLMDVLERGRYSSYYNYFDINWNHPDPDLGGKLMVPFLGKELEECLNAGEIKITFSNLGFTLNYFENQYPLSVHSYDFLRRELVEDNAGVDNVLSEYQNNITRESSLDDWLLTKRNFISNVSPEQLRAVKALLEKINSPDKIKAILDLQGYHLTYWKHTEHLINYRRFFTVNSLICLRMEADEVFSEYHKFIFYLYAEGLIQGVRIDHIDGLNDPSGYLKKLRNALGKDCYIIAEKILEAKEEMPEHWPLEGTSGYEFLSYVNQLFTDRKGTETLVDFYHNLVPGMPAYEEVVQMNKRLILNGHMAGELDNLVTFFFELNLAGNYQKSRIKEALSLFMLSLPVYRIYPDRLPIKGQSLALIEEAIEKAKRMNSEFMEELEYIHALCLAQQEEEIPKSEIIRFLRRLMQFTGPLTAKGVEDTTFYIYSPLISHVEVGDAPSTLGITIQEFHKRMIRRQQRSPYSLNATATHDTKRGEDARVRLNAISEMPELWIQKVREWTEVNASLREKIGNHHAPILNDEYFIYQSVLGGFPEDEQVSEEWVKRLKEYMVKVVREAKVMSNWTEPNERYENACSSFIERILETGSAFLKSFYSFHQKILSVSGSYSVAQAVIKATAPGIPDIYQGCELLDLSYVDPDNRRPVDFEKRIKYLEVLRAKQQIGWSDVEDFLEKFSHDGTRKIFSIWKCLNLRRRGAAVFSEGSYLPLTLTGHGNLAMGYARYHGENWCIVVIPLNLSRKNHPDSNDFSDNFISLPANSPREWRNIFTDEKIIVSENEIAVQELLNKFPVAVLTNF